MAKHHHPTAPALIPLCALFAAVLSACGGGTTGDMAEAAATDVTALRASPKVTLATTLANEGDSFKVSGVQLVRFGADSGWVQKSVSGNGQCTTSFFGSDPAPGVMKTCKLSSADTATPPTDSPAPSPAPAPAPAPAPIDAPAPAPAPVAAPAPAPAASPAPATTSLMPTVDVTKLMARAVGVSTLNVSATTEIAPNGDGAFRTSCDTSHMAFDDPIVYPGQVGRSHLHTFFGNTGTNAASTPDSIRNTGNSTCRGGIANRSAYWVPTMIDTKDGTPLVPDSIAVYYKNGSLDGSTVNAIPVGLRMIAGDPGATAARGEWSAFSYRFKCVGGPNNQNDKYGSEIPNCDVGAQVWQEIFFPQCWDGVNLDSPDHKSHMSYTVNVPNPASTQGWYMPACPSTHPVILPQISFNVLYTVKETGAALRWRLASDNYDRSVPGGYSSHGDWFNGWKSDVSDAFSLKCVRAKKDCHSHLLGDGRMIY